MRKKILYITAVALSLLVLGAVLYIFFYREDGPPALISNFFPLGSEEVSVPDNEEDFAGDTDFSGFFVPNAVTLRKLSEGPIAGARALKGEGGVFVRYVERETGHIFDIQATGTEPVRISNTTIPRVREALFAPNGGYVLFRYLDEKRESIETFFGRLNASKEISEEERLTGAFLPSGIETIAVHPSSDTIFHLEAEGAVFRGRETDTETLASVSLFTSPLGEWGARYSENGALHFLSKPSGETLGFLYSVSPSGIFTPIVQNVRGLTALSNAEESHILFSRSAGGNFTLNVLNRAEKGTSQLSPRTLPEKCVWQREEGSVAYCLVPKDTPNALYPDVWYQGHVSFSDNIWKYDTETGSASLLLDIENTAGESIDGIHPQLSANGEMLVFINKKDSSLWSFEIPKDEGEE